MSIVLTAEDKSTSVEYLSFIFWIAALIVVTADERSSSVENEVFIIEISLFIFACSPVIVLIPVFIVAMLL